MAFLTIEGKKLTLYCKYDEKDLAKSVAGSKWNANLKAWQYPVELHTIQSLKDSFQTLGLGMSPSVKTVTERIIKRRQELVSLQRLPDAVIDVPYADVLRDYQRVGVKFLGNAKRAILGDDMGTGKTLQAITTCELNRYNKVLVICPSTVKWSWEFEFGLWIPNVNYTIVDGTAGQRVKQIEEFRANDHKYLVIGYESMRLHPELEEIDFDAILVDEAHRLKNVKTITYERAKKIKGKSMVIAITGTPLLNKPEELWALLHFLYPDRFTSYWRFVDQFCQKEHNGYGWDILPPNTEQQARLRELLAPIMIRRMKSDVLKELPEKTLVTIPVELLPKQRKIYDQMLRQMFAKVGSRTVVAPITIAQITRLRQIAVSPELLNEECTESAKFEAAMDLIKENVDDHKIVVFSQFKEAIHLFAKRLDAAGIKWLEISGDIKGTTRRDAMNLFQLDDEHRVMIATIRAAGVGITLHRADIAIFLDKDWVPKINEQAEDRLHRQGQKNAVTIYSIAARDTEEQRIETILRQKAEMFTNIIDKAGEITAETVVDSDLIKLIFGRKI